VQSQGKGTLQQDGEALLVAFIAYICRQPHASVSITDYSNPTRFGVPPGANAYQNRLVTAALQIVIVTHYSLQRSLAFALDQLDLPIKAEQAKNNHWVSLKLLHVGTSSVEMGAAPVGSVHDKHDLRLRADFDQAPFKLQDGLSEQAGCLNCAEQVSILQ
jgi:hypothetical protein